MSSLNVTNLKHSEVGVAYAERCNSATNHRKKNQIIEFFERHETCRAIVANLPTTMIFGSTIIENTTSHKLLSNMGIASGVTFMTIVVFSAFAQIAERSSLKEKNIERLNS